MRLHVESELLAYLDGELDERQHAAVEAHLAECAHCSAELETLRVLQLELDAMLDAALKPVRLPSPADQRIRQRLFVRTSPPWWSLWQRRGLIAQAAMALLIVVSAVSILLPPPRGDGAIGALLHWFAGTRNTRRPA